eukprot:6175789-Pleurochrysis_carterae.AAC.3
MKPDVSRSDILSLFSCAIGTPPVVVIMAAFFATSTPLMYHCQSGSAKQIHATSRGLAGGARGSVFRVNCRHSLKQGDCHAVYPPHEARSAVRTIRVRSLARGGQRQHKEARGISPINLALSSSRHGVG